MLKRQAARKIRMRMERVRHRVRCKSRCFNGLLRVHAPNDGVQHDLEISLRLAITAGAAEGKNIAVWRRRQIVDQRRSRTLARGDAIGMPLDQVQHFAARAESETEIVEENRFSKSAAARGHSHNVAVAIDDRDVRRAGLWFQSFDEVGGEVPASDVTCQCSRVRQRGGCFDCIQQSDALSRIVRSSRSAGTCVNFGSP